MILLRRVGGCLRRATHALLCPDATNDIAPLLVDGARPPRLPVDAGEVGFGGEA